MRNNELRAAIARTGVSNGYVASQLGISVQSLTNKIKGITEFKGSEIRLLAGILELSMNDVNYIFFDGEVN